MYQLKKLKTQAIFSRFLLTVEEFIQFKSNKEWSYR